MSYLYLKQNLQLLLYDNILLKTRNHFKIPNHEIVLYNTIKLYNYLPNYVKEETPKHYKMNLKNYLLQKACHTVEVFFEEKDLSTLDNIIKRL